MAEPNLVMELQNELLRATRECIAIGYYPSRFLQLLSEHGPVATSIQLIMGDHEEFDRLWQLDRLDLSIEAIILQEPYRNLFPREVLERARQNIQEVDLM